MRAYRGRIGIAVGLGILVAWVALAQAPSKGTKAGTSRTPPKDPAIATVGGIEIKRSEFDARYSEIEQRYRARVGVPISDAERPGIRRQLLEMMIRQRLVILEAGRRPPTVNVAEAEAQMQRDPTFHTNGTYDPMRWASFRASDEYKRVLPEAQKELSARKLSEQILRDAQPDPEEARRRQERKLTAALIEYLPLYRAHFDGSYTEPTEAQMLADYRANASDPAWRRPEELRLQIFHVDNPPISNEAAVRTNEREAWEQQMLARADSVIAAVRGGASFNSAAQAFGGARLVRVPKGGTPPAPWRGTAADVAMLWDAPIGTVVAKAFPADLGRLVVRVEGHRPPGPAPISDVAMEIRERLRRDARAHGDDAILKTLYAAKKDSLKGPAAKVRYAAFDTTRMTIPHPSAADIDRYYRGHLADYSNFDATTGTITAQPLDRVRSDVVTRLSAERRIVVLRETGEQVLDGWIRKKRNKDAEKRMTFVREVGSVPVTARVDTGLAGLVLTDSLRIAGFAPGAGIIAYPRGIVVFEVYDPVDSQMPTFEQARPQLERDLARIRFRAEEQGARAMYTRDPSRFRTPRTVYSTRMFLPLAEPETVELTRPQVERYYRAHLNDYATEELVRASHILIVPRDASTAAINDARRRAEDLSRRAERGEDFAKLAREYSDDAATKDDGGDVGMFRRGMMLDAFERKAYTMKVGDISEPVRSEVGFHVIYCTEHTKAEATPLNHCYTNVGYDCALEVAKERSRFLADSVRRKVRTIAQAQKFAAANRLEMYHDQVTPDQFANPVKNLREYMDQLAKTPAGSIHPDIVYYSGSGWAVTWVDSIAPERPGSWEAVRERALETYRSEASYRTNAAKAAELDSMGRAGWSLDSLAALWGGLENRQLQGPGAPLTQLGGVGIVDSLVFGTRTRAPALAVGASTGWIDFPGGFVRLRVRDRLAAQPVQLEARVTADVQAGQERNLRARYARIQESFPVRIHDPELAETKLPDASEP